MFFRECFLAALAVLSRRDIIFMFGSRNVCTHRWFFTFDGSGAFFATAMISEPLRQVVVIVAATVHQTVVSAGVGGVSADRGGSGRPKIQEKDFPRVVFSTFKLRHGEDAPLRFLWLGF